MTATGARPEGQSRATTRLATLLAVAVFINYVDRGNLATAAPVIKAELRLSATQIGVLIGAFYGTYAFSQIGASWLADHRLLDRSHGPFLFGVRTGDRGGRRRSAVMDRGRPPHRTARLDSRTSRVTGGHPGRGLAWLRETLAPAFDATEVAGAGDAKKWRGARERSSPAYTLGG